MANENSGFDTIALHGGWDGDPTTGAKGVPVYRTGALHEFLPVPFAPTRPRDGEARVARYGRVRCGERAGTGGKQAQRL